MTHAICFKKFPIGALQHNVNHYLSLVEAAHLKPVAGFLTGWDATYLVLDALRHVELNATAAHLRGYLAGVTGWTGVNGVYDFRHIPQRGVGSDYLYMLDWTRATNSITVVSSAGGAPKR